MEPPVVWVVILRRVRSSREACCPFWVLGDIEDGTVFMMTLASWHQPCHGLLSCSVSKARVRTTDQPNRRRPRPTTNQTPDKTGSTGPFFFGGGMLWMTTMTMVTMVGMHKHHDCYKTRKRHHGGARFRCASMSRASVVSSPPLWASVFACLFVGVNVVMILTSAVDE